MEFHNSYVWTVYASMRELDEAFNYFDKAFEQKDSHLIWLKFNARDLKFLDDPRTKKLFKRLEKPFNHWNKILDVQNQPVR